MSKSCFLFPRPGALEAGHGPRARRGGAERDGGLPDRVVRRRGSISRSSASTRPSRSSSRPRSSSRRSSRRASRSWPRSARAGSSPTSSSATPSASSPRSPRSARSGRARRSASCASGARDGRGRAAAPGLDGGDPRPRGRGGREAVPEDHRRLAGQLQLSGPDRDLGRERRCRGVCAEAESLGARRAIRLKVSGCVSQPARRPGCRPAAACDRQDPVPRADRAVHVHRDGARSSRRQRLASLLVDQLTAPVKFTQAARELMRDGVTTFVEVGPGQRALGADQADRPIVRAISVNDLASLEKARETLAT